MRSQIKSYTFFHNDDDGGDDDVRCLIEQVFLKIKEKR